MIRELLIDIFRSAVASVEAYSAVQRALVKDNKLSADGTMYDLDRSERVIVIGAGKASAGMAQAVEDVLEERISAGVIITKYGHSAPLKKIIQIEAAHPLPDESGARGTKKLIQLVANSDEKTFVICLLSGGASALLVSPVRGITLQEKQRVTELLLNAGASISEMNTVRKHLSEVKGGRLAQIAYPSTVLTLILSDVIGNRLDVIASGPTVPDSSTFADAAAVIDKYGLKTSFPANVVAFIERGISGKEPETAKTADRCFLKTRNIIIGEIALALAAARESAERSGLSSEVFSTALNGEAREAARMLARKALGARALLRHGEKLCILSGGETTVTVTGKGKGGRNQELALAFAIAIEGVPGITLLSAGTDGTDGPTDAAGAIVDGTTVKRARALGLGPDEFLLNNDSYSFFTRLDHVSREKALFKTGPTGTNVMDLQLMYIEKKE